jgi:hypothetical protein
VRARQVTKGLKGVSIVEPKLLKKVIAILVLFARFPHPQMEIAWLRLIEDYAEKQFKL